MCGILNFIFKLWICDLLISQISTIFFLYHVALVKPRQKTEIREIEDDKSWKYTEIQRKEADLWFEYADDLGKASEFISKASTKLPVKEKAAENTVENDEL